MDNNINQLASNLLVGAIGLLSINSLVVSGFKSGRELLVSLIVFFILLTLSVLVRKGSAWLRYLFLFLIIFSLLSLIMSVSTQLASPIGGAINVVMNLLQLWALVLLFKAQKGQAITK